MSSPGYRDAKTWRRAGVGDRLAGIDLPRGSPMHTRRSFLLNAGASAIAVAGSSATAFAANEVLNVGLIGTGGRCRHLLKSLVKIPGVRVMAISDVRDDALAETQKQLGKTELLVTKK